MHEAERGGGSRSKVGGDLQISLSFDDRVDETGVARNGQSRPLFFFDSGALIEDKAAMAKKPGTNPKGEFAFFNVVYEDDSQRSNRRVPSELLGGLDGDEPARGYIMEQDREIAEKSGRTPLAIKSISRVGAKKK
jgi:hypothetical protein